MKSRQHPELFVEVMDTTLRDGEQTPGVSFTAAEKLEIARRLLQNLKVDRIEIASARVSEGERDAVRSIIEWGERRELVEAMEILGFVDSGRSIQWIRDVGGRVLNLLVKGSEEHCRLQLRRTPARHFDELSREIEAADKAGLAVNVYLEDWSNGVKQSFAYVNELLTRLAQLPVRRVMLADTLGVLTPAEVSMYLQWMFAVSPGAHFDFHGHNDYGLVTANALAAVLGGVNGIHVTINGLGERAGNLPLAQLVVAVNDHTRRRTRVSEKELQHASELIESISGKRRAWNAPVVGVDVYTQTSGVHADGDRKAGLYMNKLLPERFGRERNYALGKLSGKASLDNNIRQLGIDTELDPAVRDRVLQEVIRLGDKKKSVSQADLPFIIAGVLRAPERQRLRITSLEVTSRLHSSPRAELEVTLDDQSVRATATGDGGYDAFVKALRKCLRQFKLTMPRLTDYQVRIPPGGRTDALVEATITWAPAAGRTLVTTGVDSDQLVAAVQATEKMLNLIIKE